jgi:UDP-glucose 4-epimerase
MNVLVIGGAGYIGSHVARYFADRGLKIDVLDNLSTGTKDNLFPDYSFFEEDILDYKAVAAIMRRGYDAVVHLAAAKAAGESMLKPEKYAVQNLTGTINILNAACEAGIKNSYFLHQQQFTASLNICQSTKRIPKNQLIFTGSPSSKSSACSNGTTA